MAFFSLKTTTISLFLLLHAITLFSQCHASKHDKDHGSLVLGLTHSRVLSPLSVAARGLKPLEVLDMIEPLRGFQDGYLISLNLGTPPQVIQVYMDTGSDLTWVPCGNISFVCMECDDYRNYKLAATLSPSYSSSSIRDICTSPFCPSVHSSDNPYDPCAMAGCSISSLVRGTCPRPCPSFSYNYGAGGLIIGSLTRDTLRVHGGDPLVLRETSKIITIDLSIISSVTNVDEAVISQSLPPLVMNLEASLPQFLCTFRQFHLWILFYQPPVLLQSLHLPPHALVTLSQLLQNQQHITKDEILVPYIVLTFI